MIRRTRQTALLLALALAVAATASGGTLGAWLLNEGRGDAFGDSSGAGITGKIGPGARWGPGRSGREGDFALQFDGREGQAMIPDLAGDPEFKDLRKLTFEFWIKFSKELNPGQYAYLATSDRDFQIMAHHIRKERFFGVRWVDPDTGMSYFLPAGYAHRRLPAGQWVHVAVVFDGKHVKLYVNGKPDMYKWHYLRKKGAKKGQQMRTNKETGVPYTGRIKIRRLSLGCEQVGRSYKRGWFDGEIDDVALFNEALRPEQLGPNRPLEKTVGKPAKAPAVVDL